MMATLQHTIPFKPRKKTSIASKSFKVNENKDILNTTEVKREKALKRRKELGSLEINENDTCPDVKIARRNEAETKGEEERREEQQCTNSSQLKPLTCREKEIEFLETFLMEHLESEKSASLYISGHPGTGKTASLSYTLQLPKIRENYQQVYVNCTMMKSAASIYSKICKELHLKSSGSADRARLAAIHDYLTTTHKMILLVLDEIDQLSSKRQSVLYTIFEWPSVAESRLVLIGVANALDLTERRLPRLQARSSLRPRTLHFAPYTKEQIVTIFTAVLEDEDKTNVFSPVALHMLAAKIAAVSGDMRRALDLGRRVVQVAAGSQVPAHRAEGGRQDSAGTVELRHVLHVLEQVHGAADTPHELPMHQKLILCSLLLILTKGKSKDVLIGKLYEVYKKVACARNIAPLDMCGVSGACALLETQGAVRLGGGAPGRRRVRLHWDEAELAAALRDKPLLSAILNDLTCLS